MITVANDESVRMRGNVIAALNELQELAKSQQALLNSCSDAAWTTVDDREAIRWLLDALGEHRRRVRITTRLWRTLADGESLDGRLVAETSALFDENGYFVPHLAKWRDIVTERTVIERKVFWRNMITLAQGNLDEACSRDESAIGARG